MIAIEQLPARRPFQRRRKTCPFTGENALTIDYKDVKLLQRYISERGKNRSFTHHSCEHEKTTRIG